MQKATRKFQEKIDTITKIQYRNHRKHQAHTLLDLKTPELPPITNSLNSSRKHNTLQIPLSTILCSNNRKIDKQYDIIINQTLSKFKNQKINRIIFANPPNRLGKTYYRNNEFKTTESWSFRNENEQRQIKDSKRKKQFEDYLNGQSKKNKSNRQCYKNMISTIVEQKNTNQQQLYAIYFTAPDQLEKEPMPYNSGRSTKKTNNQRKSSLHGRYSPWRQQQKQYQDLLNWYN